MRLSRRDFVQVAGISLLLKRRLLQAQQAPAQPTTCSATLRLHIDPDWLRTALLEEIDHWRNSAELPNGFIQQGLDQQWCPIGQQMGTLIAQGRHMFMRARGYDLTHNSAYLDSLRRIADFTLANFRDTQYGGLFFSVSPDGKVVDDCKNAYGTAFAIFGFSHAARVTHDEKYQQAALETWEQMKKGLRDKAGFFKYATTRDYSQYAPTLDFSGQPPKPTPSRSGTNTQNHSPNTQNPMMHLEEALQAYYDATGSKKVLAEAEAHADAMFTRLFQGEGGYLPEFYDADWKPLPENEHGHIELGHQFEWAYLWSQGVKRGFPCWDLQLYGERLLNFGMGTAYDSETGGIFSVGDYEGHPVKAAKGLWQQCEFLRALMNYATVHNRSDLWAAFDKSLGMFKEHFMDAQYGGYFSTYYDPKSPPDEARLGKSSIDCYHVCGMYSEALMLTGGLI